ncbi:RDD family protein [Daejeonella sp.]|uniref:RDD family protein n=1 Tax=Daejeonella sp. TaxID=2805397 RepID=UPI0030C1F245
MQTVKIHTSQNITIDYPVAGLGERILARLIDVGLFLAIYFLMMFASSYSTPSGVGRNPTVIVWIFGFLFCFYDLVCEMFFNGQSIGKKMMKIKVVSLDGARPTLGQYLLRWVFRMVDFSITFHLAAVISVVSTPNKQRIGDLVAGTTLIKTEPRAQLNNLAFIPEDENYKPVYPEVIHLTDKEILLIHDVIASYSASGNDNLLYNMKTQVLDHLGIKTQGYVGELEFLETIVKDYNHLAVRMETI